MTQSYTLCEFTGRRNIKYQEINNNIEIKNYTISQLSVVVKITGGKVFVLKSVRF